MIGKLIKVIESHYLAIILAIIIGLVLSLPNTLFVYNTNYRGIPMMYSDSDDFYLSRINAASRGCWLKCNPFSEMEQKDLPFFDTSISTIFLAIPKTFTGLSITQLKYTYDFLLPVILSLLIYSLIYRLTQKKSVSSTGMLLILLGNNLINVRDLIYLPNILSIITLDKIDYLDYMLYSRIVNPLFSSIFFFTYLHYLLSVTRDPRRFNILVLGVLYGVSFYIYLYTYLFITSIMVIYILYFFYKKDKKSTIYFMLSFVMGIFIGIPIITSSILLVLHPFQSNMIDYGVIRTHVPHITYYGLCILATLLAIVSIWIKKNKTLTSNEVFILTLISSCFVAVNQHVISGMVVQYFHFYNYYITPIFIIFVCYVMNVTIKHVRTNNIILVVVILITTTNGLIVQTQIYGLYLQQSILNQKYAPVLNFIQSELPIDSVIVSPNIENLVPIFTNVKQLWTLNFEYYYLHSKEREFVGKNVLRDEITFKKAVRDYGVKYLVLNTNELNSLNKDMKKYIRKTVYSDKELKVMEVAI